jgi:hypothetical protein
MTDEQLERLETLLEKARRNHRYDIVRTLAIVRDGYILLTKETEADYGYWSNPGD